MAVAAEYITVESKEGDTFEFSCDHLRLHSEYFQALLNSDMRETQLGLVALKTVSTLALKVVDSYIRTGELPCDTWAVETFSDVTTAAAYLGISKITESCENSLLDLLTIDNCLEISQLVHMSMMKHLPARVHAIQCEHVQQLALKSEFMHLSFDHLCQLLGSSDLNMACELQVWKLIVKWLENNQEEINAVFNNSSAFRANCSRLLNCVRFPSIASEHRPLDQSLVLTLQKLFTQPVFDAFLDIYIELTQQALTFTGSTTAMFSMLSSLQQGSEQFSLRRPRRVAVAVGGFWYYMQVSSRAVYSIDLTSLRCDVDDPFFGHTSHVKSRMLRELMETMNVSRDCGGEIDKEDIHVLVDLGDSCCVDSQISSSPQCELLSRSHGNSQQRMHTSRHAFPQLASNARTGGVPSMFSTVKMHSQSGLRLPQALCAHAMSSLHDVIFVAGGFYARTRQGRVAIESVWRYDPWSCEWTEVASMRVARCHFSLCEVSGRLYAVCGLTTVDKPISSVEVYDPCTDTWSFCEPLEDMPSAHAGCSHQGKLFITGGNQDAEPWHSNKLWCYDVMQNSWTELEPMTYRRSGHCMVSVRDSMLVAGGLHQLDADTFIDVLTVEQYDVASDQWTTLGCAPLPATCASSLVLDDRLYLLGGRSAQSGQEHGSIMILDPSTGTWSRKEMAGTQVMGFTCAVATLPERALQAHSVSSQTQAVNQRKI